MNYTADSLPTKGKAVSSLSDTQSHIQIQSFCTDCMCLLRCALEQDTNLSPRWETLASTQTALSYFKNHLDGSVESLHRSAMNGCRFCWLLVDQLMEYQTSDHNDTYCLFRWESEAPRCKVQLAFGDVRRFILHVSQWTQPRTIIFYTRDQQGCRSLDFSSCHLPELYSLPGRNFHSVASLVQARRWLDDCLDRHTECVRPLTRLPKRVVDLGDLSSLSELTVYVSKGEHIPYATLSYSWGNAKRLLTRTAENLEEHCRGIDLDEVPKTLMDAIYVTKNLGFRYLWIDALCIIQKDKLDFAEQVAALAEIYGGSTLNISATSARHSDDGILKELPDHGTQIGDLVTPAHRRKSIPVWAGPQLEILDLENKSISSRGWVFQERLVSSATLHYTDEGMVWECAQGAKVEHEQNISNIKWKSKWKRIMKERVQDHVRPQPRKEAGGLREDYIEAWSEWISAYSERNLHECTDKLPAIAGVAKAFAHTFGLTYAAGLWKEDMLSGMMWRRYKRKKTLSRYDKYVAPSWSWASVHGRLEYRCVSLSNGTSGPILNILNVMVFEEHPGSFERVTKGFIHAEGFLQEVIVDKGLHPGVGKRTCQECGIIHGFINNRNVFVMLDVLHGPTDGKVICQCLRLGSFDSYGRQGDIFLLVQREKSNGNRYRRIGLVETDPWQDVLAPQKSSGHLLNPALSKIMLL